MNEVQSIVKPDANTLIDELEVAMLKHEPVDCPLAHTFLPGMYIREIFMPKGKDGKETWVTSQVHNTMHPYFIMKGKVAVYSENDKVQIIEAPFRGVTKPNTRRVIKILEDCIWATVHVTDIVPKDDSEESILEAARLVGEKILLPYENVLLNGHYENNVFIEAKQEIKELENA
jgi:hypothetical protein